ncbi:MAG: ComEC/Rec2 family competence protein, partial [Candidatus Saccharimonadales bacterium]
GLSLAAWYYGRRLHPLVLLPVAAAITALIDPTFVAANIGWMLTFIAYGGLILLAPLLKQFFWKGKKSGLLCQIFVDTLSVQIVTMPLLAFAFQQYSIYGLPANLLVLPLMPLTMLAIAVAGLAGMILPLGAAHIIGWPAAELLQYTDKITTSLATAPGANYAASLKLPLVILAYAVIIAVIYALHRQTHFDYAQENLVE